MALSNSSEAKDDQSNVAELNQTIDANMEALAHITDVLEETVTIIAENSSLGDDLAIRVAAANLILLEVVEQAADIARILIYVKENINQL